MSGKKPKATRKRMISCFAQIVQEHIPGWKIEEIASNFRRVGGCNVVVFNPHSSISGDLKRHATFYKNIPRDLPASCRLPNEIVYGSHNRVIRCPDAWR